jgi:hypothetical protein
MSGSQNSIGIVGLFGPPREDPFGYRLLTGPAKPSSIISAVGYVRGRTVHALAVASAPGHGFHRLDEFGCEC